MQKLTPAEWTELQEKLSEPFDPSVIKWKPQTVDYKGKTAMATAHADPRAYIDRLNDVVGPGNWEQKLSFSSTPYTKVIRGKKAYGDQPATQDREVSGTKVICACELTIHGVTHTSSGDSDSSDENASTSAEAQAFKRAAVSFGLGRYLYNLPAKQYPYDTDKKRFIQEPILPDWALPPVRCADCNHTITAGSHNGVEIPIARLVENSEKKYQKKLCQACQISRAQKSAQPRKEQVA